MSLLLLLNSYNIIIAIKIKHEEIRLIWHSTSRVHERNLGSRTVKQICALKLWNKNDSFVSPAISSVSSTSSRIFTRTSEWPCGGRLSCLRARLRTARHSRVHLTANVISPSPLLLLNDLAIVVSLLWHANHPWSLLRRAAKRATQIKNFISFSITVAHFSAIAKSFYGRLVKRKNLDLRQFGKNWRIVYVYNLLIFEIIRYLWHARSELMNLSSWWSQ